MTKKQLQDFRKRLEEERSSLAKEIAILTNDNLKKSQRDRSGDLSGYASHLADVATDNFEREKDLHIASGESDRLRVIDEALERIENKTYGTCDNCGKVVGLKRLEALPYATLCIKCQELEERGM